MPPSGYPGNQHGYPVENQEEQIPSKVTSKRRRKLEKRKLLGRPTKGTAAGYHPKVKKQKTLQKHKSEEIAAKPVVGLTPEALVSAWNEHCSEKLSTLEKDEVKMDAEKHFCECNDLTQDPVSYLKMIFPEWGTAIKKSAPLKPGSPLLIIITQAGLRAAELDQDISGFKGRDCKMVKLIAKNYKLHEQKKVLSKKKVHLGIGTPMRIHALIENGALQLDRVRRIVLDWSWQDLDYRRMVERSKFMDPLFDLLMKHIIPKLKDGTCKIGLM